MKMSHTVFAAAVAVLATSVSSAAALSEATLLRMGAMALEPTIDGQITIEESSAASTQYGAISQTDGIMAMRYAVFHVGYTAKGVYFAARTSVPKLPQTLTDDDTVTLTLLPPGAQVPRMFTVRTADGGGNLPAGCTAAVHPLKGVTDYAVLCTETELFVPYTALGVAGMKDGEKWGLQMAVHYSSMPETATWHYAKDKPDELGTLWIDSSKPILSLINFFTLEQWRQSGNYRFLFRYVNNSAKSVKVASKTVLRRGIHSAKLDSEAEKDVAVKQVPFDDVGNFTLAAGERKEDVRIEWVIWGGKVNILNLDLEADGATVFRRRIAWDAAHTPNRWKDDRGVPTLKTAFFPSSNNRLRMRYDVNKVRNLVRGGIRVVGTKANRVCWEKELVGAPYLKSEVLDINLPGLAEDDYEVRFVAEDAKGGKYRHTRTFQVKSFPWQTAEIGMDRVIIPPYVPIKVEKVKVEGEGEQRTDSISFLQTGYRCGGVLWDEIYGKGENLLAAPMTLTLNGQEFKVQSSKFIETSPDRVIREVTAVPTTSLIPHSSSLVLTVRQDYDYDGYCWVTFKFDAKEPVEVKSLVVRAPLRNEFAKYFEVQKRIDKRGGPAPDFTLPAGEGEVWNSLTNVKPDPERGNYQPYFWFGGAFKGLAFLMDGMLDCSLDPKRAPQRVVRRDGAATYEVELVNVPVTWQGVKTFEMGWQPTPVRPKDPAHGAFASLMYNYACPSNAIRCELEYDLTIGDIHAPHNTYPGDDRGFYDWVRSQKARIHKPYSKWDCSEYLRRLDDYIARNRAWFDASRVTSATDYRFGKRNCARQMGVDQTLRYLDPMLITSFWPEWEMYKSEWWLCEWPEDNYFNEYMAHICKTRIDKLMWDGKVALENGAGGLYYDCYRICGERNLGCKDVRVRPDGTIQPNLGNIQEWRNITKRSAVICYKMGKMYHGRPVVEVHDTHGSIIPTMTWAMSGLSTERSGDGGDYQDRFKESYVLTDIAGGQTGKGTRIIVSMSKGDKKRQNRELISLMGFMCAYGFFSLSDQGIVGGNTRFEKAWNMVFDFGWGRPEVEQFQYWNEYQTQPVTHTGKDVRLTVAKKADSALLMFGNLGDDAEIDFDVSGLGFGKVALIDAETGKALGEPKLSVARHGFRLVRVESVK